MKIAAYCRVSTDREEQKDSLAHQKEFFQEYARKNGHELFRLYADEGISGTSLKKRTEFQRLMRDGKSGLFELVVVKDISRVARNTVDFLQSIRVLKAHGVNVVFLTANMTSLGDSEFILTIFGAMAQEESGNLSKRVKWGKKINAKKGRVPPRIYGYDRVDNFTLHINAGEAEIVRRIFCLYREGLGCGAISRALNEGGARTRFGCEWNSTGVRRVLVNPIYCGHYINNKYEIEDFLTGKQVRLPDSEHCHHERPEWAIVTREEFRQAQLQLEARRKQYRAGSGEHAGSRYSTRHLFSTLIQCEHCGKSFCRRTRAGARAYWVCSTNHQSGGRGCENRVRIEENQLIGQLRGCFSALIGDRERFVREVLAEVKRRGAACREGPDAGELEARRRRLLLQKSRCQEMYANGVMTMEELKAKAAKIERELTVLDEKTVENPAPQEGGGEERYRRELQRFLDLETAGNADLRRLGLRVGVNRDGTARIVLKSPEFCPDFPSSGQQSIPWTPSS